jgi:hypothetical protein
MKRQRSQGEGEGHDAVTGRVKEEGIRSTRGGVSKDEREVGIGLDRGNGM